jgi:Spy/CpxP family protein refolding chaperone
MKSMMKLMAVLAVAVVAVSSFAQGGGGGGRGFGQFGRGGGMQDGSGAFLLNREDVQGELKLTTDQKSKLDTIRQAQRDKMREAFQGGGGSPPDHSVMQKMM